MGRIRHHTPRGVLGFGLTALALLALALYPASAQTPGPGQAEVLAEGLDDYRWHCTACHGPKGKGDGTMAAILVVPPADLSRIASRNDGQFPFWQIYRVIDGTKPVKGHETFQMPRFWQRFQRDDVKPGYLPAHIRILLLTHYLESLQTE